jgi:cell wall-associated NlpC family hydrolase
MRWGIFLGIGILVFSNLGCSTTATVHQRSLQNTQQKYVVQTALSLLGTPYRYGGATPKGFDCSGFVKYVFKASVGIKLPRIARNQVKVGQFISARNLRQADILYFKIRGQKSLHVGIYLGKGKFIHAPSSGGKVNIQNLKTRYWGKQFRGGRRVI